MSSLFGRRHYVWLARALRDIEPNFNLYEQFESLVLNIADALQAESPAFCRAEFLHNTLCDLSHKFGNNCPFETAARQHAARQHHA